MSEMGEGGDVYGTWYMILLLTTYVYRAHRIGNGGDSMRAGRNDCRILGGFSRSSGWMKRIQVIQILHNLIVSSG